MFKKIINHINFDIVKSALFIALIYCVLFNVTLVISDFQYYKSRPLFAVIEISKNFSLNYLTVALLFFCLHISCLSLYIGSIFLFITGAICSYYFSVIKAQASYEMIKSVFESNLTEASEHTSLRLILWMIINAIIAFIIVKKRPHKKANIFTSILMIAALAIYCYNIQTPKYRALTNYFPKKYLHNSFNYFRDKLKDNHHEKFDIAQFDYDFIDNHSLKVVLVIGESIRYDHMGLYGYERETTPYLDKTANLIAFRTKSCSANTYSSVPCLLTRATDKNIEESYHQTSFMSVFKKLGFNVVWLGSQSIIKYMRNKDNNIYNETDFFMIPGGSTLYNMNDIDEVLLPYFSDILHNDQKQLIILHSSGSHWDYG